MKKLLLSFVFVSAVFTGWSYSDKPGVSKKYTTSVEFQSGAVFSSFNAHRQGRNGTELMWSVSTSGNVLDFEIQRSYDGEFFDPISDQACSNISRYNWKDNNVFPGYIYYRIAAHMINGDVVYSDVQVVHIVQH